MNDVTPGFVADVDAVIAAVPGENPAGEWLRYSELYDEIEKARLEEDASLPQGIYVRDLKKADWPTVERLCMEALTTRSKDLQIGAWLTEAWIHLYGLRGLREGLKVLRALVDRYWDDLYPALDDDIDGRIAPLEWIDEKLAPALRLIPITESSVGDMPSITWADKEKLDQQQPDRIKKEPGRENAGDGVSASARFQTAVTMTPTPFFRALFLGTVDVHDALDDLVRTLAPYCGKDTPHFQRIRNVVGAMRSFVEHLLEERQEALPLWIQPPPEEVTEIDSDGPRHHFRSRAEAYRMLLEAAEYLARVEPHSPTPYLVRRAVAWGGMTLIELLEELVKDRGDRGFIYELLGVKSED